MTTLFMDAGGDADQQIQSGGNGMWGSVQNPTLLSVATDFVNSPHVHSLKFSSALGSGTGGGALLSPSSSVSAAATRVSFFIYIVAMPTSAASLWWVDTIYANGVYIRITSAGVLQLWNSQTAQIGSNGPTLSTGNWYRISLAFTQTSTTVNRYELFVNGVSAISVTNATMGNITGTTFRFNPNELNGTMDFRLSDIYVDNSNSLTDPGNIYVTAKRPVSNGSSNQFTTQIGSGGSGYGTGHSSQVNERPLSTANGWSVVAAGANTEEYNIEGKSVGDINISSSTIVDYLGWVSAKSLVSETASIIVNNTTSNISLTSSISVFRAVAGSSSYPAGTGTDIGITTSATATTVSLYECGIMFAYINSNAYSKSLSDSVMNGSSRSSSLGRIASFLKSNSDNILNGASRTVSIGRIASFLKSASDSIMNAASRFVGLSITTVHVRIISDSIMNGAQRFVALFIIAPFRTLWAKVVQPPSSSIWTLEEPDDTTYNQ